MKRINLKPNTYFNIVGPDGAGKDSAMELVEPLLGNVVYFREPGGTVESEVIREIILTTDDDYRKKLLEDVLEMDVMKQTKDLLKEAKREYEANNIGMAEVYLYAASRSESNKKVVLENLSKNNAVVGSRSISCSMAYQGKARGIDRDFIWETNMKVIQRLPDFEIFLDIPTEIAMQRIAGRTEKQDRLDLEGEEFHRKSREGYKEFYAEGKFPVYFVDATQSIEQVAQDIYDIISDTNQNS